MKRLLVAVLAASLVACSAPTAVTVYEPAGPSAIVCPPVSPDPFSQPACK